MPKSEVLLVRRILHAVRQPLGAMSNRLHLLGDESLSPEGAQHIEALRADVKRMADSLEEIATELERRGYPDSAPSATILV